MRPLLLALAVPLLLLGSFHLFVKPEGRALTLIDYMEGDACSNADFSMLETLPPSRIMAPTGLSITLAEHFQKSALPHTVAAIPFHRASSGMERVFQTFVLTDSELRRRALAPYDYVAVCTIPETDADPSLAPVYAKLSSGENWPGLEDISQEHTSRLRLLKIDHDTVE